MNPYQQFKRCIHCTEELPVASAFTLITSGWRVNKFVVEDHTVYQWHCPACARLGRAKTVSTERFAASRPVADDRPAANSERFTNQPGRSGVIVAHRDAWATAPTMPAMPASRPSPMAQRSA